MCSRCADLIPWSAGAWEDRLALALGSHPSCKTEGCGCDCRRGWHANTPLAFLPALRQTAARRYHECRGAYRAEYLWQIPQVTPSYFVFGGLEHALIQKYLDHLIITKQEYAPQDVDGVWLKFLAASPEPIPETRRSELKRVLRRFSMDYRLLVQDVWKTEALLTVDHEFKPVTLRADGTMSPLTFLHGAMDLVRVRGSVAWIDDWKSNFAPFGEKHMAELLQPRTYAMLVNAYNPRITDVEVSYHFVRYGTVATLRFNERDFANTRDEWRAIATDIYTAAARVDDDAAWPLTPGSHCDSCAWLMSCPLGNALNDIVALSAASAEEKARAIMVGEARLKALRTQVKGWVGERDGKDGHGPVDVDGVRFDYYASGQVIDNVPRIAALAEAHHIEPFTFLGVDNQKLKKIMAKDHGFRDAIAAEKLIRVRSYSFTHKPLTEPVVVIDAVEEEPGEA